MITPKIIMWWYNTGRAAALKGATNPHIWGVLLTCEIRRDSYLEGFRSVANG